MEAEVVKMLLLNLRSTVVPSRNSCTGFAAQCLVSLWLPHAHSEHGSLLTLHVRQSRRVAPGSRTSSC